MDDPWEMHQRDMAGKSSIAQSICPEKRDSFPFETHYN